MQSKGFITLIASLLALACVYHLSFTFKTASVEKDAQEYAAKFDEAVQSERAQYYLDSIQNKVVYNLGISQFTYKQCKEKEINLGLDLKGGMNVILEIKVEDILKSLAGDNQSEPTFVAAIEKAHSSLADGTSQYVAAFVEAYKAAGENQNVIALFQGPESPAFDEVKDEAGLKKVLEEQIDAAIASWYDVIGRRVDNLGVMQPNIQRMPGSNRILVELPGVKEPQRVRDLLKATATLEFWTTYHGPELRSHLRAADAVLKSMLDEQKASAKVEESAKAESSNLIAAAEAETPAQDAFAISREESPLLSILNESPVQSAVLGSADEADVATINSYLQNEKVLAVFPSDVKFMWSVKADANGRRELYVIKVERPDGKAPIDGSAIADARASYSQNGGSAEVSMSMNSNGMTEWARLTGDNVGRCIAIVLDNHVYSAPNVRQKIEGGNSSITGDFTIQEAQDLANVLKSGKVPAKAEIVNDTVVGPSLGQESINAGLLSFLIAFILVLLYMGIFYRGAGWVSDIALLANVFFLVGILVSFGAVLTLPGIAGIVLTMGMAVDANVIIFERIKEELRGGKGLAAAIKDGFANAYSAIIDGNLTTIITGVILYVFGTGPVQGFAITLIIGIVTSLFCSIFITRLIINAIVNKTGSITFSRKWSENWLSNVSFDFVGKRKISYVISGIIILVSVASLFFQGLNKGVEFTGGNSYVVTFDQPVNEEAVREAFNAAFGQDDAAKSSTNITRYGEESKNQLRIVTQYKMNSAEDGEIDALIYGVLKPFYAKDITLDEFTSTKDENSVGIVSSELIGPSIAGDTTTAAIWAIALSLLGVGLYITLRFRKWQWALGATLALAHDAFIVIGVFSIFYSFMPFNLEINQAFIAAILTIVGYSINDTVVIFDRIREYGVLYPKRSIKENINNALCSTLARTLNTSGTTLVTLLAIFVLGGETIQGFVFALLVGVVVGTYSSLFIATPLAYDMLPKKEQK